MKSKAFLCLSAGLALFMLGGLFMNEVVQAQYKPMDPYMPQVRVSFDEDPFAEHGRNIQSWCVRLEYGIYTPTKIVDVPIDKRLVITDLTMDLSGTQLRIYADYDMNDCRGFFTRTEVHFNSGIVFEPGESVYVYQGVTSEPYMNISGYWIDL